MVSYVLIVFISVEEVTCAWYPICQGHSDRSQHWVMSKWMIRRDLRKRNVSAGKQQPCSLQRPQKCHWLGAGGFHWVAWTCPEILQKTHLISPKRCVLNCKWHCDKTVRDNVSCIIQPCLSPLAPGAFRKPLLSNFLWSPTCCLTRLAKGVGGSLSSEDTLSFIYGS